MVGHYHCDLMFAASLSEDGKRFDGMPMRVQLARGGGPRSGPDGPRARPAPAGAGGPPQRSGFRVRVFGLPPSASWQDLKDHMRRVGDVGFTEVDRRGGGVVEFTNEEGMDRALRELHRSEFRNRFNDVATIEVEADRSGGGGGGGGGRGGGGYGGPPPRDDDRAPPPRDFGRDGPGHDDRPRDEDRHDDGPRHNGGVDASADADAAAGDSAPRGDEVADVAADEGAAEAASEAVPVETEAAPEAPAAGEVADEPAREE